MRPPIMMRRINVVLIFFTICLLSSCATSPSQPTVLTNTTAFFDDNYSSSGRIYLKNKYQIPKPMFEFYNQKIAKYLSLTGFEVMAEENQADRILTFKLEVDDGTTTTNTGSYSAVVPNYNPYNPANPISYGTAERAYSYNITTFKRAFKLDISNIINSLTQEYEPIFTAVTTSNGSCNNISEVFDEMLFAMFNNFDSANGQNRKLNVAGEVNC